VCFLFVFLLQTFSFYAFCFSSILRAEIEFYFLLAALDLKPGVFAALILLCCFNFSFNILELFPLFAAIFCAGPRRSRISSAIGAKGETVF
jgi:hypothetical protein